jgi:hypothetical protein
MTGQQLPTNRREEAGKPVSGIIAEHDPTDNVRSAWHKYDAEWQQDREENDLFADRQILEYILGAHGGPLASSNRAAIVAQAGQIVKSRTWAAASGHLAAMKSDDLGGGEKL